MIALINLILAVGLTVLFSLNKGFQFSFPGILWILLTFVVAFIIIVLVLFLFYVVFVYLTEKTNHKSIIKHKMMNAYSAYIFNFFYHVKVIVTGKENLPDNDKFVIYSNHVEYTDPIYIMQIYKNNPIAFVAKEPLFKYPVLKNLLYGIGCIPISRYADRSALKTILQAIKQVKGGQPMGVFPEGKRTYSNDLIDFKPGAFRVAQKGEADISPVCLFNMHDLAGKRGFKRTKVYIHILPIIKYEDYKHLDSVTISNMVYKMINDQLDKYKAS